MTNQSARPPAFVVALIVLTCGTFARCEREHAPTAKPLAPSSATFADAQEALKCKNSQAVARKTPLLKSKISVWCWAASGEMVMDSLETGVDHSQCLQANCLFKQEKCCRKFNKPDECRNGGIPPLGKFRFDSAPSGLGLTRDQIVEELCVHERPFLFVRPVGTGSHMTVVVDYDTAKDAILIHDPWTEGKADRKVVLYRQYQAESDSYAIHDDLYKIRKMP